MLKLAVIGKDVSKSLSPPMHKFILGRMGIDCEYEKISLSEEELKERADELFSRFDGFNVTIPHKQTVLPYLKTLEGDAGVFGAVNTVVTHTKAGFNTDGMGFMTMLTDAKIPIQNQRVLVLGAGGAGRSCIYALQKAGAVVSAYERDAERLKAVYHDFKGFTPVEKLTAFDFDIIVNCTGIGMHDTVGKLPLVPDDKGNDCIETLIKNCRAVIDLIYEPKESALLILGKNAGKATLNGEAMLFYQAYAADCIFTGRQMDMRQAKELWREFNL